MTTALLPPSTGIVLADGLKELGTDSSCRAKDIRKTFETVFTVTKLSDLKTYSDMSKG